MALTNCTINSSSIQVTKGNNLTGVANQVLTITPDPGYVVAAADFTKASPPTGISSITLGNSHANPYHDDNRVTVTCDYDDSFVANANLTFTIDIDGAAVDKKARPWSFAGHWAQKVNANITASPVTATTNQPYSGSNTFNSKTTILTQFYEAASGYYFTSVPTFTPTNTGVYANNYEATITEVSWSAGRVTKYKVVVTFKTPEAFVSGHGPLDINSGAVVAFDAASNLVSGVTIDQSNLPLKGPAQRTLRVYGNSGCSIQIAVRSSTGANYNVINDTWTSAGSEVYSANITMPSDGFFETIIDFLDNGTNANQTYDIKVKGGTSPATNTAVTNVNNNDPFVIPMTQRPNVALTVTGTSSVTALTITPTNNIISVGHGENVDKFGNAFGKKDLSMTVVHSSGKNMFLRRQPVFRDDINYLASNSPTITGTTNDFTNTQSSANGGTEFEILGLNATGDGTATLTIASSVGGFSSLKGGTTSPVQSVLNIDNFVNQIPVANPATRQVDHNTATTINLTGSDPEGDTLTYAIVQNPLNGTISNLNTSTGSCTFTPATGTSGNTTFTFKVNDGFEDSANATITCQVASAPGGGGGSVGRYELDIYNNNGVYSGTHYIHATQTCSGGSLAATCMNFGSLNNKWVRWRTVAGGCGSTEYYRGQIKGAASNGTPTAYVSDDTYYNSMADSVTGSNGITC
jgi:hypothetical protein